MKKTFFLLLGVVILFSFTSSVNAVEKKPFIDLKPQQNEVVGKIDLAQEEARRERYDFAKAWKEEKFSRYLSQAGAEVVEADNPNAVNIQTYSGTTYWQADSTGDLVWTGACYNDGTSGAVFVKVEIDVYDAASNYLGSDSTYIWGGHNVKLNSTGTYTNALGAGESGFFLVWTNISYAQAATIYYKYTYSTSAYTNAMAQLSFDGSVYYTNYLGYLDFYGDIKNTSPNYVTYYTVVAFAAFDTTNTDVLAVDWAYVDGASYGASSSAIYPNTSEPFDVWFLFGSYSEASGSYLSSFEWDEAQTGGLSEQDPPFGQFATPIDGSTVASSIAVTGWALDDSGVDTVKIYRESGGSLAYIGDATFVEGARPDVAALYPQYPNNTRAGWGYMMLTNFLPNGGNGTYVIHALATDIVGKTTDLGAKTIYCDNDNAVKPFGAIDTPTQGGTASGNSFVNWGWVLTPQPNSIPTDGSTINVWVDGVNIGHPYYNKYRADLAQLFPGYANSNGAAGYFYLDTTGYSDGLHSIQWTAKDSGNNSDGIGSRYFQISNNRSGATSSSSLPLASALPKSIRCSADQIKSLPVNNISPIRFVQGYDQDFEPKFATLDGNGLSRIQVKETERVEIHLTQEQSNEKVFEGYLMVGNRFMSLPVGSTLNSKSGVYSWNPGPGFLGKYHLVFVGTDSNGSMNRRDVLIEITPGTAN